MGRKPKQKVGLSGNFYDDVYLGNPTAFIQKLQTLADMALPEEWNFRNDDKLGILKNYLCYTYERIVEEGKISVTEDNSYCCFNTGLLNHYYKDIYVRMEQNTNDKKKENQDWYFQGVYTDTDNAMRIFDRLPELADYYTNPSDFIYDKKCKLSIDYTHILDDNEDRFMKIGMEDKNVNYDKLVTAIKKIEQLAKRNYNLALPCYYTDKGDGKGKIQLMLPLFLKDNETGLADLVLVVTKDRLGYVGKTILLPEQAYVNARRIVSPSVSWLKIK